ncbi:mitochondrial ribonuclease P catalytic subunit [Brevipalpus obovatus]|uniref:mitochondrial ribonuclease P catalytic subunit n=1 Tax=Brevipalpus obovatus TaxID=246614 RepID=UPI003D9EFAA5
MNKVTEISPEIAGELLQIFEKHPEELTRLMNLFHHKQFCFPSAFNHIVGNFLRQLGMDPVKVTVDFRNGECNNCHSVLDTFNEQECAILRDHLKEKVLIPDGNVYVKTTPREIQLFNEMLEKRKDRPFDLVIDTLNCSYWASDRQLVTDPETKRIIPTNLGLKESLHEILDKGKIFHRFHSILVVGRKHMTDWRSIELFRERPSQVEVFLLDNSSDDDVFMLYAALQNSQTKLISQDYMRQHEALLEPEIQRLFQKWKRCRMIRMKYKKDTRIFYPQGVDYVCQTNDHHLHIPINISEAHDKDEIHMIRWWCAALPLRESQKISNS